MLSLSLSLSLYIYIYNALQKKTLGLNTLHTYVVCKLYYLLPEF
jgi:hypothetical protein